VNERRYYNALSATHSWKTSVFAVNDNDNTAVNENKTFSLIITVTVT